MPKPSLQEFRRDPPSPKQHRKKRKRLTYFIDGLINREIARYSVDPFNPPYAADEISSAAKYFDAQFCPSPSKVRNKWYEYWSAYLRPDFNPPRNIQRICFKCKEDVFVQDMVICTADKCGKVYHKSCVPNKPTVDEDGNYEFLCERHVCMCSRNLYFKNYTNLMCSLCTNSYCAYCTYKLLAVDNNLFCEGCQLKAKELEVAHILVSMSSGRLV